MYKDFFGLKEPPFNLTPDPRFFYMSRRHQEALAALVYGVRERKGFILLTGEIGAGKTTLSRTFLSQLNHETTNVALVLNSYLTDVELLQTINDEFDIDSASSSKKQLIDELNRYLLAQADKGKTTVIIIDEAQNLTPAVLEQVRMLSNLETESAKLIQIVLMGQPELARILARPDLEELNQRIMVRCHIGPLDKQEIYHYIRHRLQVAGARINVAVNAAALNRIFHYSEGIPRRINVLLDRALLAAYVAGQFWMDSKLIATAENELRSLGVRRIARKRSFLRPHPSVIFAFFAVAVLFAVGTGAFWFALNMDRFFPSQKIGAKAGLTPTPVPVARSDAKQAPPVAPVPQPSPTPTPSPAPLTLEALSTSATLAKSRQWTYDANGIARVSDPDLAGMASLVTISKLWRIPVQMDSFRTYDKSTLLGINLQQILNGPQINLRSFETSATLGEAIRFDLPLVLTVEEPAAKISPSLVLLEVIREKCVLADPRLGRIELSLPVLEGLVRDIRVFYVDPDNFAVLLPGTDSEKENRLRAFLAEQGMWRGKSAQPSGEELAKSIEQIQSACQLQVTGRLDGPTAACIAARKQAFRPRLIHVFDAK